MSSFPIVAVVLVRTYVIYFVASISCLITENLLGDFVKNTLYFILMINSLNTHF